MLVLNFAHPLTEAHCAALAALAGAEVERQIDLPCRFDLADPFSPQAAALVDTAGLSPVEWQTTPLLVNPPTLAVAAAVVLAEIHGRAGYFPAIVRLRPVRGALTTQFEVAEILNLQSVREAARGRR